MGAHRPQAVPLGADRRPSHRRFLFYSLLLVLLGTFVLTVDKSRATSFLGPDRSETFREAVVGDVLPLDPHTLEPAPRDPNLPSVIFRGLVRTDIHGRLHPDLAESWQIDSDGRVYSFTLRPGLTWDDEAPLTSHDVAYSIRRAGDAAALARQSSIWSAVDVRIDDARTLQVVLREPIASFLPLAALPIVAAHAPPPNAAPLPLQTQPPAVSGPYRPVELAATDRVILERNPHFDGLPTKFKRLEFRLYPTREAALAALLAGEVDTMTAITPEEQRVLADSAGLVVHHITEFSKQGLLVFNTSMSPLDDRAVRQALALGVDREALVRKVLGDEAEAASGGPLSPLSWAYDATVSEQRYEPTQAQALLDVAGWRRDASGVRRRGDTVLTLRLVVSDADVRVREAREIARQLAAIGVEVETHIEPLSSFLTNHLEAGSFTAALVGRWLTESDPDQFASWHSSQLGGVGVNYSRLSSTQIDRLLELGRRGLDVSARYEAYHSFQKFWAEEQPAVVLYHPRTAVAMSLAHAAIAPGHLPDSSWRLRVLTLHDAPGS